jgi:hypothetical protein
MSTDVTMQELELEQAELLPSRETLCYWNPCRYSCHSYNSCHSYDSCHSYNPCHSYDSYNSYDSCHSYDRSCW